ncbi:SIR2 family NAD-dependent protein deacylase [Poseidonocella sedimentorum]|uniref:SIR2-like domain-containing protein n=1 Tax=Poseidonocella sedimentorum TaxID=871652 RepID=A0A1I6CV67_9RHOB|nr:SIR2 family protein [Poseidonocella sedimentorum]SFQ97144.1 SIR2-like domain-containing protein [Poseidonocella sedimentorum]
MPGTQALPRPSTELREAYRDGALMPWVGAGLSSAILAAGGERLPGYSEIIQHLCDQALAGGWIARDKAEQVGAALAARDFGSAARTLRPEIPHDAFGRMMWDKLATARPNQSQHHLMLNLMQFPVFLTTNYDWVLDDILRPRPRILTYRDHETLLGLMGETFQAPGESPFVFKLNGDLSAPRSIVLGQADRLGLHDPAAALGQGLRKAITAVMQSRSLLFLGYSFDAPGYRDLLVEIGRQLGPRNRPHFAIIPRHELDRIPTRAALEQEANVTFFPFDVEDAPKDGDTYRGLWQFLSQIPDHAPGDVTAPAPGRVVRTFYPVRQRSDYLAMQRAFEADATSFRFLTSKLTNALASREFLDTKVPQTLKVFDGIAGLDDWETWKTAVVDRMQARADTLRTRLEAGAEIRVLSFEEDTLDDIATADRITLERYRMILDQCDVHHHDLEIRFIRRSQTFRSLMSFASLVRPASGALDGTDLAVAYAAQATPPEFLCHVFEMNTEFARDMLIMFEREWARAAPLETSLATLRGALLRAERALRNDTPPKGEPS